MKCFMQSLKNISIITGFSSSAWTIQLLLSKQQQQQQRKFSFPVAIVA